MRTRTTFLALGDPFRVVQTLGNVQNIQLRMTTNWYRRCEGAALSWSRCEVRSSKDDSGQVLVE